MISTSGLHKSCHRCFASGSLLTSGCSFLGQHGSATGRQRTFKKGPYFVGPPRKVEATNSSEPPGHWQCPNCKPFQTFNFNPNYRELLRALWKSCLSGLDEQDPDRFGCLAPYDKDGKDPNPKPQILNPA